MWAHRRLAILKPFDGSQDWGGASFAPLCQTLASSYLGAEPSFLKEHEVKLLKFFADEYQEVTGVNLDRQQLLQNFKLAQASGIAGCCANIQWCLRPGLTGRLQCETSGCWRRASGRM